MTFIYLAKYIKEHNGARSTSILPSMLGKQKIARCMVLINCVLCACNVECLVCVHSLVFSYPDRAQVRISCNR